MKIIGAVTLALFLVGMPYLGFADIHNPSPLQQVKDGTSPSQVACNEGLELVLKTSDGSPACVMPSSMESLIERGWADHVLPDVDPDVVQNSDLMKGGSHMVETSNVTYGNNTGFLAVPTSDGPHPGIIMIHEWWGLNENIEQTAEKLASHGYVVLAVDLFDGEVATDAKSAMELTGAFVQDDAIINMNNAVNYLETTHDVDMVGSIGWCFGGQQSLVLAMNNDEMDATVIYYGRPVLEPEALSSITWPVLGIFAELDQGIPPETVDEFRDALNEAGVINSISVYHNVDHAFANPTGERYDPDAADDAWNATLLFLSQELK